MEIYIGTRFDRWRVAGQKTRRGHHIYWPCVCDCGTKKLVNQDSLKAGNSRSCGCLISETTRARRTVHGHTAGMRGGNGINASPEYSCWQNAIRRCYSKKSQRFAQYGGRGITMCARWRGSFSNFIADMGLRPEGHSLDRIDTNGHYSPENCRWATDEQQRNNMRQCVHYDWHGERMTLAQIERKTGIPRSVIYRRIKRGWNLDRAATEAVKVTH